MVTLYKAKAAVKPSRVTQLTIERLDHEAQGVAREQGVITFIQGVLPGERVQVKVTEQKKQFQRAQLQKVLEPSPLRQADHCAFAERCGGCQLSFVQPESMLALKQAAVDELLKHQLKVSTLPWQAPIQGEGLGYRRKARIGVWFEQKTKQFHVGFRGFHQHEIEDIPECVVLSPALAPILGVLRTTLPQLRHGRAITHAEVLDADGQAYVVIRHIKPLGEDDKQRLQQAWPAAFWLGEAEPGVVEPWHEQPTPSYALRCGTRLSLSATDFVQVNAAVNQQMIDQALAWLMLQKTDHVLDLYCGIGNFSLAIAPHVASVTGIEGVDSMVERARANAGQNGQNHCQFAQADLHLPWGKAPWAQATYDKVVLDPARAGAEGAVEQLAARKIKQMLYVSCNPTTFARDAKVLLEKGYRIDKIGVMDMFPYTSHLELMALFKK